MIKGSPERYENVDQKHQVDQGVQDEEIGSVHNFRFETQFQGDAESIVEGQDDNE
jgi:hypothetical protein